MKKLVLSAIVALGLLGTAAQAEVNLGACAGCHGKNFERKAMGKSAIVKDMNATAITTALKGYKAGTYGGAMKGIMKGQVAKYSDTELEAAAQKIKDTNTTDSTSIAK